MIKLQDVFKTYDNGTKALKGVTLTIRDGEFVFIVGPSGSGKSTMTKLLTAEVRPTSGKVSVNGYDVGSIKQRDIPYLRRTLGVVFQDFRLIENKTVYENVAFVMRAVGTPQRQIKKRVTYVLDLVGVLHKARRLPSELSGGEQQRVAIARALAKNPRLLLCDEPTGALDYVTGKAVLKLLYDLSKERGMTVIIITHNQAIAPMADRIIRIKSGKIRSNEINENIVPIDEIEW